MLMFEYPTSHLPTVVNAVSTKVGSRLLMQMKKFPQSALCLMFFFHLVMFCTHNKTLTLLNPKPIAPQCYGYTKGHVTCQVASRMLNIPR